jgi:cell division protein FtsB
LPEKYTVLRKILRILTNRFLIATLAFGIWIIFFDNYSLVRQYKLQKELKGLEEMKQNYLSEIAENKRELEELVTNKKTLEKFAREKHLMKRDNEDIYIVIEE